MRYKQGLHQYTQREMNWRIRKLFFRIRRKKGFDILLAHSPAYHINDGEDLPHTGFKGFRYLMEKYAPRYFIHGHMHLSYGRGIKSAASSPIRIKNEPGMRQQMLYSSVSR